jgi:hypothetical protein
MNEELEIQEFLNQCLHLDRKFNELRALEPSDRVWMSVMGAKCSNLINAQDDPELSLRQFIDVLQRKVRNQY